MLRRDLLVRTGLTLAAGALAAPIARSPDRADAQTPPSWEEVRAQFNLDPAYLHFGGLLLAAHPAPVRDAIETHRRGLDANPVDYLHQQQRPREAAVLRSAAAYLGVNATDIALTDSTTMGLGLLYNGLDVRPGQDILTTTHDFFATHEALALKAQRVGASLRRVALYDRPEAAGEDEIVQRLAQAVLPETRVVAVTWVHSSTGVKLPIRGIADALAELNAGRDERDRALLCVDGVHGLGVESVMLPGLGCDFFVAGCHKWLFGPRGTGLVWGSPRSWPAAEPTIPSFSADTGPASQLTPGGFHSFEHRWALAQAFDFHRYVGKERVAGRVHDLNRQLKEGLAAMPHVRVLTPLSDSLSAGLVVFSVAGSSPAAVVQRLHDRGIIATTTPYVPTHPRLAAGLLNSPEEVDAVLGEVAALG